jgi:TrmH family RNA methyltransferase
MVGSEADGLTTRALAWATQRVRIPMVGGVDSLNVATAAAIGLHHFSAAP